MAASSNLIPVLFYIVFGGFAHSARLNVGRLLLPSNQGVATNYTLEVTEGGCYKWTSSRQEIIAVVPIEVNLNRMCSTKAILSAVSTYPGRHSVIVLAVDEDTGLNLRCDVTVDVIHFIEIVTTTREIFLEDAPVAFEVQAQNDQEDTFSCLDGVAFEWIITDPVGKQAENKVLRFLNYADSPYETLPAIDFWEQQGLHGYKILMEGVKTGTAKASVRPRDTIYKNIRSSEVTLMIVANLMLNPARDVYILPLMTIHYQVDLIKQRKAYVIPMPSDQYYLEIANPEIATLDSQTSTVTGLSLGFTQIVLKDKNIKLEEMLHQPSAGIHVINPSHIIFRIKPGNKWSLQELLSYVITIEIYDDKNNEIHLSDNLRIHATFPSKYFYVHYSSINGSYHNVQALVPGTCKIQGEISGIMQDGRVLKIHTPVSGYQEVTIYQAIRITPSFVFLPWNSQVQPKYVITLKAVGGTGSYRWLTSNNTIAMLSNEEHLDKIQVITRAPGTVNITAVDMMNSLFTDFAKVTIYPIASLEILPTVVETEVGKDVILPLAIYGFEAESNKRIMFHNCSQIPINVHVNPSKFIFNEATDVISSVGCRSLLFTCKVIGHSEVVVQYNSGEEVLNATAVIACHKQLQPLQPVRVAVLALGSSLEVAFEGGPRPWPLHVGGHYVQTQTETSSIIDVAKLHDMLNYNKDIHVSRVLCRNNGEVILNITVGNVPSTHNPNPMKSHASVKIVCAVPYSIQLQPKKKEPKIRKLECPLLQNADKLPVHCYQDLDIVLLVQDKLGRRFLNISSLHVRWELSDDNLAKLDNAKGIVSEIASVIGYRKVIRNFQKLHPHGKEGQLKVTASIVGYNQDILYKEGISAQWSYDVPVHRSLILDLVHDAEVTPETLSVFNHPSIKSHLNIVKGSGHFYVESSDRRKANIQYKAPRQIEIVPIEDGAFTVTVQDLCLESTQTTSSQVQVSGISSIHVHMMNKVELGKSFIATVSIADGEKNLLPSSLFSLVNLTSIVSSDIISIKPQVAKNDLQQFQAKYLVTGLSLGHTSVIFAASYTRATTVSSEPLPIQVFPPIHIEPRNVTLITGAMFQVTCSGGPQPQSNVEYSVSDKNIASVTSAGIIGAGKLGKSILTAKAIGIDQNTGQSVVYSQDQIAINVVVLKGIKIKAPLTRMEIDTEMPVYAVGLNEQETPFAFGSAVPKLYFKWFVTNQNVVEMKGLYHQNGIQHSNENNFAMVVQAKQAGRVTLRLEMSPMKHSTGTQMQIYQNSVLMDEVQIEVYEKLKLTMPEADGNKILMSPNSQIKLLSNRDGMARISYSIVPFDNEIVPDVTLDSIGILKTGSNTGVATVLIVAHEEFDVEQRMSILVEVKSISYMSVNADAIIRTDLRSLAVIPLGLKMTLHIHFHDDVGRKFHALNIRLKFRPSRFDLIQMSQGQGNSTLKMYALKTGMTVMKIWDANNPHIMSYISMIVGTAIDPVERLLTIGDIICFSSPLITQEGQYGSWFTTSNLVAIHPTTGIAVSQQIGTDNIYYNVSNILVTSIQVSTKPIAVIVIDRTTAKHLTNVPQEKPFRIPILLRSDQNQRQSNLLGRNCSEESMNSLSSILFQFPFVCELSLVNPSIDVSASEIFEVKAGFDWQKGQYHCAITPISRATPYEVSILVTDVQLHVRLLDSPSRQMIHPTAVLTTEAITFPFYPAFHLRLDELVLSNVQPSAEVAVSAVPFVQKCLTVLPSDSNILDIHSPKVDSSQSHTVLFTVAIRDISSLWQVDVLVTSLYIEVSCAITKQLHTIPVKLKLIGLKDGTHCPVPTYGASGWKSFSQAVWENYQSFMVTTLSVIGTGAALFIGYRALVGSRSPAVMSSQPNVFLHSFGEGYSPAATLPYTPRRPFSPGDSVHTQGASRSLLWSVSDASRTSPERHSPNLRTSHIGQ